MGEAHHHKGTSFAERQRIVEYLRSIKTMGDDTRVISDVVVLLANQIENAEHWADNEIGAKRD